MGKKKTVKAIAKRFKKTARGKVMAYRPGKSHLLGHKSRKRKRHLRNKVRVSTALEQQIGLALA